MVGVEEQIHGRGGIEQDIGGLGGPGGNINSKGGDPAGWNRIGGRDSVAQGDRQRRGVLEDEAQLPAGERGSGNNRPSARVPHLQLPSAVGILADQRVERLLGLAVEVEVRAGRQERRRGKLDWDRGEIGVFGEHQVGRDRAGDGGGVFPEGVGVGVVAFVHDNHNIRGGARTEGDSGLIRVTDQARIIEQHIVVIDVHGIGLGVHVVRDEQDALVAAHVQDVGTGIVIARASDGEDVGLQHHAAQAVSGRATSILAQQHTRAAGADECKHHVGDAGMIHIQRYIKRGDGLVVGHEEAGAGDRVLQDGD